MSQDTSARRPVPRGCNHLCEYLGPTSRVSCPVNQGTPSHKDHRGFDPQGRFPDKKKVRGSSPARPVPPALTPIEQLAVDLAISDSENDVLELFPGSPITRSPSSSTSSTETFYNYAKVVRGPAQHRALDLPILTEDPSKKEVPYPTPTKRPLVATNHCRSTRPRAALRNAEFKRLKRLAGRAPTTGPRSASQQR